MKPTVRFFRHAGICRPMGSHFKSLDRSTAFRPGSAQAVKDAPEVLRPTHRRDEFRPAIPQRVARQQSPPPLHRHAHPKSVPGSGTMNLQRTVNSVLTVCLSPGDNPISSPGARGQSSERFMHVCKLVLRKTFDEREPALRTWQEEKLTGLSDKALERFTAELERSVNGTPRGRQRRAAGTRNEDFVKLMQFLESALRKHSV
jgi:hypothetical protein